MHKRVVSLKSYNSLPAHLLDATSDVLARMAHWPLLLLAFAGAAAVTTTGEQPRSRKKPAWSGRLATYSIASVARREQRSDWNEVTQGNKIVLPRSVYDTLVSRGLSYKQFQIINPENREKKLFTGPLDFCAADGASVPPSDRSPSHNHSPKRSPKHGPDPEQASATSPAG